MPHTESANGGHLSRDQCGAAANAAIDNGSNVATVNAQAFCDLIEQRDELLEALQSFVDEVEGTYPFESLPAARAAISKAKGSP